MTFDEAKSILLLHSYSHPDTDHPTLVGGFLGSLRPYTGLNETNFHAVMSAIIALAPYIQQASTIDKEVVSAVWAICGLSRAWGIRPDGMLRRNNLIMDTDVTRLEQWIDCISWAMMSLLEGYDLDTALDLYSNTESL